MKPIIFNTEMVKAILEGRKTVTRRIIKPQPSKNGKLTKSETGFPRVVDDLVGMMWTLNKSPYQVGNILYVRETWKEWGCHECAIYECIGCRGPAKYVYKASGDWEIDEKWRPSIHMPKEAARIFLKVTDVRVERLQDITEEQALKEGVGDLFLDYIAYSGEKNTIPLQNMKH